VQTKATFFTNVGGAHYN